MIAIGSIIAEATAVGCGAVLIPTVAPTLGAVGLPTFLALVVLATNDPPRDHRMGSQDNQEMAECGPKILARVPDRRRTPAMRQVPVEKLRDHLFVKVLRVQFALAKVNQAAEVSSLGRRRIAAIAEIPYVGTYARRQRASERLIGRFAGKLSGCSIAVS